MVNHNIVAEFTMILCGNNSPRCGCINGDDSALCGDIHAIMLPAIADGGIGRGIEFCGNGTAVNRPTARCIAQCCQDVLTRVVKVGAAASVPSVGANADVIAVKSREAEESDSSRLVI